MTITYVGNEIHGLSTDTKPTPVATGKIFIETDSGDRFIFNGAAWVYLTFSDKEWTGLHSGEGFELIDPIGVNSARYSPFGGSGPFLALRRGRGTSITPEAIDTFDILGTLTMLGYDGATFREGFKIEVEAAEDFSGQTNAGVSITFRQRRIGDDGAQPVAEFNATTGIFDLDYGVSLSDTSTDPVANGEFRRNGADVKVFTGGSVLNFSSVVTSSGITSINSDTTAAQIIAAGLGMDLTDAGATHTLAIDTSVVPQLGVVNTFTERIDISSDNAGGFNVQSFGTTTPFAFFRRAKGTTASPEAIITTDVLGKWELAGFDGTSYRSGFQIMSTAAENFTGSSNAAVSITFQQRRFGDSSLVNVAAFDATTGFYTLVYGLTTPNVSIENVGAGSNPTFTSNSALQSVSLTGNLGINVTDPQGALHVHNGNMRFTDTGTGSTASDGVLFGLDVADNFVINNLENAGVVFQIATTPKFLMDNLGKFIIHDSLTTGLFTINNDIAGNTDTLFLTHRDSTGNALNIITNTTNVSTNSEGLVRIHQAGTTATTPVMTIRQDGTGDFLRISQDDEIADIFTIKNNGNVGIGTDSPDSILVVEESVGATNNNIMFKHTNDSGNIGNSFLTLQTHADGGDPFVLWVIDTSTNGFFAMGIDNSDSDRLKIRGGTDLVGSSIMEFGRSGGSQIGFHGTSPKLKLTVTGSRSSNAALTSLLAILNDNGLVLDSSSS
jgi:hypothetical protein